jgi:hypothetical protein
MLVLVVACEKQPMTIAQAQTERAAKQKLAAQEEEKRAQEERKQEALKGWEDSSHHVLHILSETTWAYDAKTRACWMSHEYGYQGSSYYPYTLSLSWVPCAVARPHLPPSHIAALEKYGEVMSGGKAEAESDR